MVEEFGIVDALIPRIRRIFPQTSRLQAVSTLVELADRSAAPFLRSLLDDRNDYVRTHAAHGLARIHDLTAVPLILDLSTRVRPWEAARLTDSLIAFGTDAVPLDHRMGLGRDREPAAVSRGRDSGGTGARAHR